PLPSTTRPLLRAGAKTTRKLGLVTRLPTLPLHRLPPIRALRSAGLALAEEEHDLLAVAIVELERGDEADVDGLAHDPRRSDARLAQVQVEARIEDVEPLAGALHPMDSSDMDLDDPAVGDEDHEWCLGRGDAAEEALGRGGVDHAREVFAEEAEGLRARDGVAP